MNEQEPKPEDTKISSNDNLDIGRDVANSVIIQGDGNVVNVGGKKRSSDPTKKKPQQRKRKINPAIVVALIGSAGTIIATLLGSPLIEKRFSPVPSQTESTTIASTLTPPVNPSQTLEASRTILTPNEINISASSKTPIPINAYPTPFIATEYIGPLPTEIIDSAGITMRLVPAGVFTMGRSITDEERPVHEVMLGAFYMDIYEVTNEYYTLCRDAGVCTMPSSGVERYRDLAYAKYPVAYVDWYQAKVYCEWRGTRLPTEAEWEKAARGTDGRTFPWGEELDCNYVNYSGRCNWGTGEVGTYEKGKSIYGLYDMAGNVWEWVSSLPFPYPYDATDGREDLDAEGDRVIRGGSWYDDDLTVSSAKRALYNPDYAFEVLGFRCAKNANP